MSKKFTLIILSFGSVLVMLLISLSVLRSNKPVQNETIDTPIPTQKSITQTSRNSYPQTVSDSDLNDLQAERLKLLESSPITQTQIESLQRLKDALQSKPVDNSDFAITYDSDLNQFFIQLRSESADQNIEDYLAVDPELLGMYKNDQYDFFRTSSISPKESIAQTRLQFDTYQEQKYLIIQDAGQDTFRDVSVSPSYNDQRILNQTSALNNLIKSLASFRIPAPSPSEKLNIMLPNIGPISPTDQPQNRGIPSNLDALFAEAGQRVGIPPPLIKAVMAHECGILLSESKNNIDAWSQPDAGLPSTHKCFDGGVKKGDGLDLGPMQFYLPRYFEVYSQSVNQFGKYNRARPYVENIIDSVYASAYKLKLDSKSTDAVFSCTEVKRASWCYACGCSRYDNGNLNAYGCRFAPGLFQYLWGHYTIGKPLSGNPPC